MAPTNTATDTTMPAPARLSLRLHSLLVDCGGTLTRPDIVGYLAGLWDVERDRVRDVLCDEQAAGTISVSWSDATARLQITVTLVALEDI